MAPQDLLDEFFRYVQNDIPPRFILASEMRIVDRSAVQEYFQPFIEGVSEQSISDAKERRQNREECLKKAVKSIVGYGILSHRWLPHGEPTLKEMKKGRATGPGYQKLSKFCEIALASGQAFVWSDTCCIDKTSSSELDEAIRSMFRWYRNASICIVFLGDTISLGDAPSDEWFKRGWTLQELLASRAMKFFNKNWSALSKSDNDKLVNSPILSLLSQATGITKDQLVNFIPGPFAVDTRMKWAAHRRTTRGEDIAYSLMGMFDITMQIAYGEGSDRAFSRLILAILHTTGTTTALQWSGRPAVSYSSKALPSSPACYDDFQPFIYSHKLEVSMTSRGLRIPMILLPLKLLKTRPQKNGTILCEFSVDRYDIGHVAIHTLQLHRPGKNRHWALGVFNYLSQHDNPARTGIGLHQPCIAYLLARRKEDNPGKDIPGKPNDGSIVRTDLSFYDWVKISTEESIIFEIPKLVGSFDVLIVDDSLLETVYL